MKITGGVQENGICVGNAYDKYNARNPIVRYLMRGFENSLESLVKKTRSRDIHEVGCGEGYWTLRWFKEGYAARGSDFSTRAIEFARMNARDQGLSPDFKVASVYGLVAPLDAADLIVCCEVLEHLEHPDRALAVLQTLAPRFLIISVPQEPIWRILNLLRGQYWQASGNTPGHVQHWSKNEFVELIGKYFEIVDVRSPLPWTMILARPKS
jgi:ubiquinone/menaquinone biosynthesis C-methylase UbiE